MITHSLFPVPIVSTRFSLPFFGFLFPGLSNSCALSAFFVFLYEGFENPSGCFRLCLYVFRLYLCTEFEIDLSSRSSFCSLFAHHLDIFFLRQMSGQPQWCICNGLDALFKSNLSRNVDSFHLIYLSMCYYNANFFLHIWIYHSLRIMPI